MSPVVLPPHLTPLKSSLHRTVLLDVADHRVIKRFRSRGRVRRLFDPLRVRAESNVAAKLRAAGLPIPELLEPRESDGPCEVHFRWIPRAETLDVVHSKALPRELPLRLARTLGRLLGQAHDAGLDHRDLHAGNVLLDESGEPWLIDFQHARIRRGALPSRVAMRDLVHLAAAAREVHSASFRAFFLRGWLETAPLHLQRSFPASADLANVVEALARTHHRDRITARSRRWFRMSRVTAELEDPQSVLVRRDLRKAPKIVRELCRAAALEKALQESVTVEGRAFELLPACTERWRTLARLEDHGIPGARVALHDRSTGQMAFEITDGTPDLEALNKHLPRLLGRLHDRGLDALEPYDYRSFSRALAFGPQQRIEKLDPAHRVSRLLASLSAPLTLSAIDDYLAEERGGATIVRALRAELESALP